VGQKVRGAGKQFRTTGDFKNVVLFGQHLWREGGRRIVITEGEVDCLSLASRHYPSFTPSDRLSASQALGDPALPSVSNGACHW
jgi:hypothetical protein